MSNQEKDFNQSEGVTTQNEKTKKEKKPKKQKTKKQDSIFAFSGRRFRNGSFSAAMILIVVAIVIVINLIVSKIPAKYTQIDVSSNQIYSMSAESKKLLSSLKEDVTIYYLLGASQKKNYPQVTNLLEKYQDASDKIKVVQKDPELYPNFGDQYDAKDSTVLIVESEKRFKLVDYYDIYNVSNYEDAAYYGANPEYEFNGENLIANAVNYVVTNNLPKAYLLEGNGELELGDSIKKLVEDGNITVESLNLLTKGEVPKDADCLIILSPENDFSKEEAKAVIKYLQNGGNAVIFSDYLGEDKKMPNFMSVLEAYGVTIDDGIIYEGNSDYSFNNMPTYTVPEIKSLDASKELVESKGRVLIPSAQSIVELDDKSETLNVAALLTTSDTAFLKANPQSTETYEKEDGDKEGPFNTGVVITDSEKTDDEEGSEETEDTEENIKTKLVVFGSSALVDESIYNQVTKYNASLFTSTLGWMCDCEDSISIASKSITEESLTITDSEVNTWMSVYLIAIPLIVIATGIAVAVRRKRR